MGEFVTSLRVEKSEEPSSVFGRAEWTLTSVLVYNSDVLGKLVIVPTGFRMDFASVPRLWVAYALAGDVGHAAAVVHDYLLVTGVIARSLADKVFLEALEAEGVPAWRRYVMYAGVRVGTFNATVKGIFAA